MNELLAQFLIESRELVQQATDGLLALEESPRDAEHLDAAFRAFHTLKGGAGIVEFAAMERALHAAEDVLSAARSGARTLDSTMVGECLACLDQVVRWLDGIEQSGALPAADATDAAPATAMAQTESSSLPTRARDILAAQLAFLDATHAGFLDGRIASAGLSAANVLRACGRSNDAQSLTRCTQQSLDARDPQPLLDAIRRVLDAVPASAPTSVPATASASTESQDADAARPNVVPTTLRVDAERIDALVRLTGELTVAKNSVGHLVKVARADGNAIAPALKDRHAVLEHLVGELQQSVLAMRVLPLRAVLRRFARVVREMSAALGKPVTLGLEGEDTEADKAIIEMLFEPLLHVVRNAVDHGVELPAIRAARGKPAIATIRMRAQRQADQVLIEVNDDGGGIDVERIRSVALARGIATQEVLQSMSDAELIDLVFARGFSTATEVTALSGRGVGMDAVRAAVERVGGRVFIESRAGHGSTVRFALPFSVMMTPVMTVDAGGQLFGVPLDSMIETMRVPAASVAGVGAARVIVLRNRTIPVFDLAGLLGTRAAGDLEAEVLLVIVSVAGHLSALQVDRLGERMDVILKPLEGLLLNIPGITGTTLLGDGQVLLVLDIGALLQ